MEMKAASKPDQHRPLFGLLAFWTAVAAAASVTMIGVTSFTPFNPPGWLRIASMAPLPFLLLASLGFGLAGLKSRPSRAWSVAGLVIAALSVIAFLVMVNLAG